MGAYTKRTTLYENRAQHRLRNSTTCALPRLVSTVSGVVARRKPLPKRAGRRPKWPTRSPPGAARWWAVNPTAGTVYGGAKNSLASWGCSRPESVTPFGRSLAMLPAISGPPLAAGERLRLGADRRAWWSTSWAGCSSP